MLNKRPISDLGIVAVEGVVIKVSSQVQTRGQTICQNDHQLGFYPPVRTHRSRFSFYVAPSLQKKNGHFIFGGLPS